MNNIDLHKKDYLRGIIYLLGGFILLLYSFGFLQQSMTFIIVILAVLLILYGAMKLGIVDMVRNISKKR